MRRALKVCAERGCSKLTRSRYCVEHERARQRSQFRRRYREGRIIDYGQEWKAVRDEYLLHHPYCVVCGGPAAQVDHIVPVRHGGALVDWSNLQAMCVRHHSQKTARQDGGFGNG